MAADTERGLLVPVVRDVDRKGILELSSDLARLSEKARTGKLSLDEMQGGGFTITNLGGIGGVGVHADRQLAGGRDSRHLARVAWSRSTSTSSSSRA